jgi:hypothetical protein
MGRQSLNLSFTKTQKFNEKVLDCLLILAFEKWNFSDFRSGYLVAGTAPKQPG